MEFDFINDYLRVHEWVSKMVTFNLLEGIKVVLLTLMFPKMDLVHLYVFKLKWTFVKRVFT